MPRYHKGYLHPPHFMNKPPGWKASCPWPRDDSGRPLSMVDLLAHAVKQDYAEGLHLKHPRTPHLAWRQVSIHKVPIENLDIPRILVTTPEGDVKALKDPNKYAAARKASRESWKAAAKAAREARDQAVKAETS